jgi:predicted metal-dependent hydrolase
MMQIVKVLTDRQLGEIVFRKNTLAKKYIIRIKEETVSVTIPRNGTCKEAEKFFQKNSALILREKEKLQTKAALTTPAVANNDSLLRRQAISILPALLADLAGLHGFVYKEVKIRKSKTRWGSCSSKGTISLSFYLMLLPQHLITYVLLHELCHTIQMNHSPAFWALLDEHTHGQAKPLRKELKQYKIP